MSQHEGVNSETRTSEVQAEENRTHWFSQNRILDICRKCSILVLIGLMSCSNGNSEPWETPASAFPYMSNGSLKAFFPYENLLDFPLVEQISSAEIYKNVVSRKNNGQIEVYSTHAYYESQNKFLRLDLRKDSTTIRPELVSDLHDFQNVCHKWINRVAQISLLYETGGADDNCSIREDNQRFFVDGRNSNVPPKNITTLTNSVVVENIIETAASINLSGYLSLKNNQLVRYDTDFENPVVVTTFSASDRVEFSGFNFRPGAIHIVVNGAYFNYDDTSMKLDSTPVLTIQNDWSDLSNYEWINDVSCYQSQCVFAVMRNGGNVNFYLQAENTPAALINTSFQPSSGHLFTTASSIFYITTANIDNQIRGAFFRLPKSGGDAVMIDDSVSGFDPVLASNDTGLVYYNKRYFQNTGMRETFDAVAVNDGGQTVAEHSNSRWISIWDSVNTDYQTKKILLAKNLFLSIAGESASLEVVEASSAIITHSLGLIPDDVHKLQWYFSRDLLTATVSNGSSDMFYYNIDTPGSLRRVTKTPDVSEAIYRFRTGAGSALVGPIIFLPW